MLAAAINSLSEREKIVVTLYYFEGLTLAEIGEILGVTESRVCQIHTKAVGGLRGQLSELECRPIQTGRDVLHCARRPARRSVGHVKRFVAASC